MALKATANVPASRPPGGKQKGRGDQPQPQQNRIEFALPSSVVQAVQSLSTRATQDLWTAAPVPFLAGTAEQNLQRRTNLTNKLAKRLSGNERAKVDMAVALQAWFGFVSQHMLGLLAQVRAIGQRLDDDTAVAAREMREILSEQPSETTAAQVNKALAAVGPIWSEPQEQEVLQLAARLRAFGTVTMQPVGNTVATPAGGLPPGATLVEDGAPSGRTSTTDATLTLVSPQHWGDTGGVRLGAHLGMGSVASFGATDEDLLGLDGSGDPAIPPLATELPGISTVDVRAPTAMPSPPIPAGVDATALPVSTGGRWRKRSGGHTERPSKSPRREIDTGTPWPSLKTGRTPDKAPRSSLLAAVEDEAELIPAEREPPRTWEQAWTALLQFAVSQVYNAEKESEVLTHCGAVWQYLQQVLSATCPKAFLSRRMLLQEGGPFKGYIAVEPAEDFSADSNGRELHGLFRSVLALRWGSVWRLGSVPAVVDASALAPVRFPGGPCVEPVLQQVPAPMRDIGVFAPSLAHCPQVLHVDDRTHGALLFRQVCSALGLQTAEWSWRRQVETLPSLPPEQYVLTELTLPWFRIRVPVDLRAVGGSVSLLDTFRHQPGAAIIRDAAVQQGIHVDVNNCLCRLGNAWFVPQAYVLLLPQGDALQDVFSTSLSLPGPAELAFHSETGVNAVVLYANGLFFTFAPMFADHLSIRSTVMGAFMSDVTCGGATFSHFARVLPPLEQLPAVQFVALQRPEGCLPGLIDFRPLGAGLAVLPYQPGASPATRLALAVATSGEPVPECRLAELLARGSLVVLHREHSVDPDKPLEANAPAPLVVLRRRTLPEASPCSASGCSSASGRSAINFGVLLAVTTRYGVRSAALLLLVLRVSWGTFLQPDPDPPADGIALHRKSDDAQVRIPLDTEAGVGAHHRLAQRLSASREWASAEWSRSQNLATAPASHYYFQVASPGDSVWFLFPGDRGADVLKSVLLRAGGLLGRGFPILVQPSAFDRCVRFISPARSLQYVTVLVDAGGPLICLDVVRSNPGPSILQALVLLFPGGSFRLDEGAPHPLRHGDVVVAHSDDKIDLPDVGALSVPMPTFSATSWLVPHTDVFITSADQGLLSVEVPKGFTKYRLESALQSWYGEHRCGTGCLIRLPLSAPAVDLFCLIERTHSTLTVMLTDVLDCGVLPIVLTVSAPVSEELPLSSIRGMASPQSSFWNAVLDQQPTILRHFALSAAQVSSGLPFVFFQLGLDFCRLSDAGWSQSFRVPGLNREFKPSPCTGQLMHGHFPWAIRIGEWVRAACTLSVDWPEVMSIGGLTTWDLPGVEIHGQLAVWKWPGEVSSLAGECGHLFQEGHDAFACDATRGLQARINGVLNQPSVAAFASVVSPAFGRSLTTRSCLGWWLLLPFLLQGPVPVLGAASDTDDECPEPQVFPRYDSSPPVAVAWCYELSCQTTHLGVMPASLWGYCQANAPTDTIRFHIWTPFQGPAIFDYPKGVWLAVLFTGTVRYLARGRGTSSSRRDLPPSAAIRYESVNEISHQLTMLTSRLEVAGVLPGSEPDEAGQVDCLELYIPLRNGASFFLGGGEDTHLLRPSDEDAARTGTPVVGQWPAVAPTFDHASIPTLQGRVIAFMCEVDDRSNRDRPFLPAGCPLTIHNPFTVSDQCSVVTPLVGSGQEFRFLLQDFSGRRGWQQILPVQPQPDAEAVHLIPAAADSALASVVLRTHRGLHPVCLPATLPVGPSRALTLGGRFGRLREPYPLRRNVERPVHLRDGDCLLLDSGPFGPPPPTPVVTSGAAVLPLWLLAGVSFRYVPMRFLVFLPAVQAMLQWTDTLRPTRRDTVDVGSFAWRDARFDRTLEGIVSQPRLRCVLLCPLTGMQGPREIATRTAYPALLGHYQAVHGDWIRDVVPVWPGLFRDRLVLVPDIGADPRCVCIVACHLDTARAFLVPGRCTFDCLLRTLRHLSGWPIMHLGVSPSVRSSLPNPRTWELSLRTADVLEVFTGTKDVNAFVPQMPLSLVSQVRWTAPFVVAEPDLVGVWSPVHGGPIFTRVDAGAFWTPEDRTFEGSFRSRWPGSWVPIPWHPGNCVHLMQASTSPGRAHIIHESREGVVALAFTARTSRSELAEELHSLPEYMSVLGATPEDTIAPLVLRDGDVVLDSYVYEQRWLSVWNRGRRWRLDNSVCLSIALLIAARQPALFGLLVGGLPTAEAVRRGRSRTPSSAHSSADSDDDLCPRANAWRPEHPQPMLEVLSSGQGHYHILSPFHSGAFPAYFTREVAGTTLDGLVAEFCGRWSRGHVLLGPTIGRQPMTIVPGGLADLATVVVSVCGRHFALLLPRHFSLRELRAHLALWRPWQNRLVLPPSLSRCRDLESLPMGLRDGDVFGWHDDHNHPHVPEPPLAQHRFVNWLPHLTCWHASFSVKHGGWVYVWHPHGDPLFQCERHWVHAGSRWLPGSLQFVRPRCMPGNDRWVPAQYHADGACHFVRQAPPGAAHVLQHRPFSDEPVECLLLERTRGEDCLPPGWQVEHRLRRGMGEVILRDGDTLIPSHAPSLTPLSAAAAAVCARMPARLVLWLLVFSLSRWPAAAMFVPPEALTDSSVRVGKFPWRLPPEDRALHESIPGAFTCRLLSPFGVRGDPAVVMRQNDTVEEVRMALTGSEPVWSHEIVPVWPSPSPDQLVFVPVAPSPAMACLVVLSVEWQMPVLIPNRADMAWLLDFIRGMSPGPLFSLRGPPAAVGPVTSAHEAVRWRDGDLVLAFPTWRFRFFVLMDRVPPLRAFGTWLSGPWTLGVKWTFLWSYGDQDSARYVHVCLLQQSEIHTSTLFKGIFRFGTPVSGARCLGRMTMETLRGDRLLGTCHTVHALANAATCQILLDRDTDPCFLLGQPQDKPWAELRNGDIVHFPDAEVSAAVQVSRWPSVLFWGVVLSRALGWRGYLAFLLLSADAYSAQAMREAPPRDTGQPRHCLWCPAHGRLGPFLDADTALYATGWNSLDVTLAPVRPAPLSIDSHWVPGWVLEGGPQF
ncbi:unnamed protein product [Symbiodinium sp. CCMP2592]|nr:unnamed protein product [Symbiodinium sp. CCMP2592]